MVEAPKTDASPLTDEQKATIADIAAQMAPSEEHFERQMERLADGLISNHGGAIVPDGASSEAAYAYAEQEFKKRIKMVVAGW